MKNSNLLLSGLLLVLFGLSTASLTAQDPLRFREEVENILQSIDPPPTTKPLILFTGSSSVRMWKDITDYFPGRGIINTGFGGSQMSDLLYYLDRLVLQYEPDQIFIYEGDNDLSAGKKSGTILKDTRKVVKKIRKGLPEAEVVLISPKPSLARWSLREAYEDLNRQLARYAARTNNVRYVDVWQVMLDEKGDPREDIFIEDGLHMNKQGYDLWAGEIGKIILE